MKSTIKLIKNISKDVLIPYKNFIHWNISKIVISIAQILLWFLMALPFIIVLIILYFSFWLQVYFDWLQINILSMLSFLGEHPVIFIIFMLFSLLWWLTMLFAYSYRKVLFTKLNLTYLDWEKMSYLKNSYFDFKLIKKFMWVISMVALYMLIPVLIFLVLFLIIFFMFWWSDWVQTMINSSRFNPFTIVTFTLFTICLLAFLYIWYRLYFAVVMLSDNKKYDADEKISFYLKESYKHTKSLTTLLRFITMIVIVTIIILPFWSLGDHFSSSLQDVRNYQDFQTLTDDQKKTLENSSSNYYINKIKLDYSNLLSQDLKSLETTYFYLTYLFVIINFLLIFGLLEMVVVSFYKHEILSKKSVFKSIIW